VLEEVTISFFENLKKGIESTIFIKDGAKMHIEVTKIVRERHNIKFFKFEPPSSPDLNVIEKIWK
jgi:hypothetical protein